MRLARQGEHRDTLARLVRFTIEGERVGGETLAKGDPHDEITRDDLFVAVRRIPTLTVGDVTKALRHARVDLATTHICKHRSDLRDEAEVREALRHHVEQTFQSYFSDALHSLHAGQVKPSVHVRDLLGLLNRRSRKPYTEIVHQTLGREVQRQDGQSFPQIVKSAAAYEKQKVSKGRGGQRHEGDRALTKLYDDLASAYQQFTGRNPSAHFNKAASYDGPYIRFIGCLFDTVAGKSARADNALIRRPGRVLAHQTAENIRDRWIDRRRHDPDQ